MNIKLTKRYISCLSALILNSLGIKRSSKSLALAKKYILHISEFLTGESTKDLFLASDLELFADELGIDLSSQFEFMDETSSSTSDYPIYVVADEGLFEGSTRNNKCRANHPLLEA